MLEPTMITTVVSSAGQLASILLERRKSGEKLKVTSSSGESVTVDQSEIEELLAELRAADTAEKGDPPTSPTVAGGLALTDVDEFFRTAKGRVDVVFKARFSIALIIAAVLVSTVVGAIIGLAIGNPALAGGLGGAALLDLITAGVYKPINKIRDALIDAQRLDMIHLSAKQQLSTVSNDDGEGLDRYQKVWANIYEQVKILDDK